jgi:hypothetical protein
MARTSERSPDRGVRVTATLSREQERKLRDLAAEHKVSVAWLIRHAVDQMLKPGQLQLPLYLNEG